MGKPEKYFYDNLDTNYETCLDAAFKDLEKAGAQIVPVDVPEAKERENYFPVALPSYALGVLGREWFSKNRGNMDTIVEARCASGLEIGAAEFIALELRRYELWRIIEKRLEGFDGWVTPTMAMVAPAVSDFDDLDKSMKLTLALTQDTQPGSLFGLCGTSSNIQMYGSELPVGLQVLCPGDRISEALSIGLAIEQVTGKPPLPDVSGFLD
jgi:aspartyl-tRNA(Asn)/glutamyl-tRNA(Gln) amidotransferase subunit A